MIVKNIPWFTLQSWNRLLMERSGSFIAVVLLLWFIRISFAVLDGLRFSFAVLQIRRMKIRQDDRLGRFSSFSHLHSAARIKSMGEISRARRVAEVWTSGKLSRGRRELLSVRRM